MPSLCVCVCVLLSVTCRYCNKIVNVGSCKEHHMIAQGYVLWWQCRYPVGPPIPVYRIPGYCCKCWRYWYRYCTIQYRSFRYRKFWKSAASCSTQFCLASVGATAVQRTSHLPCIITAYVGHSQSHTALLQSVGQPASLLAKQPHAWKMRGRLGCWMQLQCRQTNRAAPSGTQAMGSKGHWVTIILCQSYVLRRVVGLVASPVSATVLPVDDVTWDGCVAVYVGGSAGETASVKLADWLNLAVLPILSACVDNNCFDYVLGY